MEQPQPLSDSVVAVGLTSGVTGAGSLTGGRLPRERARWSGRCKRRRFRPCWQSGRTLSVVPAGTSNVAVSRVPVVIRAPCRASCVAPARAFHVIALPNFTSATGVNGVRRRRAGSAAAARACANETVSFPSFTAPTLAWTWMTPGTKSPASGSDCVPGEAKPPMTSSIAFTEPFLAPYASHPFPSGARRAPSSPPSSAVAPAGRSVPQRPARKRLREVFVAEVAAPGFVRIAL